MFHTFKCTDRKKNIIVYISDSISNNVCHKNQVPKMFSGPNQKCHDHTACKYDELKEIIRGAILVICCCEFQFSTIYSPDIKHV
jgi:hypothetical protein